MCRWLELDDDRSTCLGEGRAWEKLCSKLCFKSIVYIVI